MLRKITRTCANELAQRSLLLAIGNRQSAIFNLDIHSRPDGVAVGFRSNQTQGYRMASNATLIAKDPDLRSQAALEQHVEIAVTIQIGGSECTAVFGKIEAGDTRKIVVTDRRAAHRTR